MPNQHKVHEAVAGLTGIHRDVYNAAVSNLGLSRIVTAPVGCRLDSELQRRGISTVQEEPHMNHRYTRLALLVTLALALLHGTAVLAGPVRSPLLQTTPVTSKTSLGV